MEANFIQPQHSSQDILRFLESGQLHYRVCDFEKANELFEHGLKLSESNKNWDAYVQFLPRLLRISIERMDDKKLNSLWLEFLNHRKKPGFPSSSRVHYTMGIYFSHVQDFVQCHEHFKSALDIAISQNNLEDEAYARIGLAGYYHIAGQKELALAAIQRVKEASPLLDKHSDLVLSAYIFEASIFRSQRKYNEAIASLAYAQSKARNELNHHMILTILYGLGLTYRDSGNIKKAQTYFDLALSLIAPLQLPRLYKAVSQASKSVSQSSAQVEDLILLNQTDPVLLIKGRGPVALKNQFLLINLLKLLASQPRRAHSKEEIVESLWQESYHPLKHDNKLYVTIRRLRRLIEINEKSPNFVIKEQEGYLINPSVAFRVKGAD